MRSDQPCLGDRRRQGSSRRQRASPGWAATSVSQFKAYVEAILTQFQSRRDEMAQAISLEMGAPYGIGFRRTSWRAWMVPPELLRRYRRDRLVEAIQRQQRNRDRSRADWRCWSHHALELADEPSDAEGYPNRVVIDFRDAVEAGLFGI